MAQDGLDELGEEFAPVVASVREHLAGSGYHLTYVFPTADGPGEQPLCYSLGLWRTWSHPELVLYGLDQEDSSTILVALADAIRAGSTFAHRQIEGETFDRAVAFLEIPPESYEGRIPLTIMFYRGFDFPALQVVAPDEAGRFPWDPGCDAAVAARQPLLGPLPVSWARRA